MIRINLLGQARPPKVKRRRAVPLEATLQVALLLASVVIAAGYLFWDYYQMGKDLDRTQQSIIKLTEQKARLDQLRQEIATYEKQQAVLQQRINVIEQLQRNRTGGQELLKMVAGTVDRTETLWLTNLTRQGNALTIEGRAGSINAVANFITQLKRSGYFDKIEIKEAHQDEQKEVTTFSFSLTVEVSQPAAPPGQPAPPAAPKKG